MVKRDDLIKFLNDYLKISEFKDYGPQGLQVEGKDEIHHIVTGVSASARLFEIAAMNHADLVMVHHGILWDKENLLIKGGYKKRLKLLLDNDITLLAYHLPLDKHPVIGNNALAAQTLGMTDWQYFAEVGILGNITECSFEELLLNLKKFYKSDPIVFPFGPEKINRIGICSGGAQREITEAIDEKLDAYITGEVSEPTLHLAREGEIHFIAAGHYATEIPGIKALGELVATTFNVTVEFIDIPNPV